MRTIWASPPGTPVRITTNRYAVEASTVKAADRAMDAIYQNLHERKRQRRRKGRSRRLAPPWRVTR